MFDVEAKEICRSETMPKELEEIMHGKYERSDAPDYHLPRAFVELDDDKKYIRVEFFKKGPNGDCGQEYSHVIYRFDYEIGSVIPTTKVIFFLRLNRDFFNFLFK